MTSFTERSKKNTASHDGTPKLIAGGTNKNYELLNSASVERGKKMRKKLAENMTCESNARGPKHSGANQEQNDAIGIMIRLSLIRTNYLFIFSVFLFFSFITNELILLWFVF